MTHDLPNGSDRDPNGTHAAVLARFAATTPEFRPAATPEELVEGFTRSSTRGATMIELYRRGDAALPAVRAGLRHESAPVRQWCAIFLDQHGDDESLAGLLPLLDDPSSKVRLWAVHSISCQGCKHSPHAIDPIPLLLERATSDPSIRVRRHALAMLAELPPDARATPLFGQLIAESDDAKLRTHAKRGLERSQGRQKRGGQNRPKSPCVQASSDPKGVDAPGPGIPELPDPPLS